MGRLFLAGPANFHSYDISSGLPIANSKTMIDDSIDITVKSQDVRSGQGGKLQFVYFDQADMKITLTESQFSLNFLASTIGTQVQTGTKMWTYEDVVLGTGGSGTLVGTPITQPDISGSTVYGYITDTNERLTFTGKTFTSATHSAGDTVCVAYYAQNNNATYIDVAANIIPSVVRGVLDAQLFSTDSTVANSTLVGTIQIEIDRMQFDGSAKLEMKTGAVSNTPLSARALDSNVGGGCSSRGHYARITQSLVNGNWYDDVIALASISDPIDLNTTTSPYTVTLKAIHSNNTVSTAPNADITWQSSASSTFTVSNVGVLTKVAAGSATLTATITGKTSVSTSIDVVIS